MITVYLPSTVGVVNALLGDLVDAEFLDLNLAVGLGSSSDGGKGSLRHNGGSRAVGVLLGQLGQLLGNLDDIVSAPRVALGVGTSLRLVTESVIRVGQNGVELVLEELRDEGGRKRQHENLVLRGGLFTESLDGGNTHGQVVTANVVDLSLLDERPDVRLLQMLDLVLVGRSKVGAHATVVAGDDDTTLASGLDIVDPVFGVDTSLGACLLEDIGVLVFSDTANVESRVVGENVLPMRLTLADTKDHEFLAYLGTTSGVLSSTTGNQLGVMVLQQFLVETHMLVLGQDGIVVLQAILLQESSITIKSKVSSMILQLVHIRKIIHTQHPGYLYRREAHVLAKRARGLNVYQ